MAGKISEMSPAAALAGTERIECLQSADNLYTTPDAIRNRAVSSLASLTSAGTLSGAESIAAAQSGNARHTTPDAIRDRAFASAGSLTAASAPNGTEIIGVSQGGAARRVTLQQIADLATGAAVAVVSATEPGSPVEGLMWLDIDTDPAALKIWIDGSPGEWFEVEGGGGGGLTHWTESVNTTTPNATVPVVQLLATNAATNVDACLTPKGSGAILAQVPTGTTVGGNKRGSNAVDLQTSRSTNTQVASGINSVISGGDNNQASSVRSSVGGGTGNTASSNNSRVGGGQSNTASGSNSVVAGGGLCTASAQGSAVLGGASNTASGVQSVACGGNQNLAAGGQSTVSGGFANATGSSATYSWIPGGFQADVRGIQASHAWSAGQRAVKGDRQHFGIPVFSVTTDANPAPLASGTSPGATNVNALPNNSAWAGPVWVVARSSGGDTATWLFHVLAKRGANAAATSVPFFAVVNSHIEAPLAGITCTIVANTTRGSVEVEVAGLAATTIDWFGEFFGGQVVR